MRDDNDMFSPQRSDNHQIVLTISQTARACGVSVKTVRRWIADDGLAVHRLPGRGGRSMTLIHRADLDVWLAQFKQDAGNSCDSQYPTIRIEGRRFFGEEKGTRKRRA